MSSKVNYRPNGYHTLSPYLIVKDGAAALEFYVTAFGAVVGEKMMTPDGRVMHAEFQVGDSPVMLGERQDVAAEATPHYAPVSLYAYVEDADAVFAKAIAAGAQEVAAMESKFYGNREGGVTDPFGITWWLATRIAEPTAEEMQQYITEQKS